ncbi:hypothetical protein MBLNU457_3515t1 [Dothideomycetes sp. NU457]
MAKDEKNDPAQLSDIPHERAEARPDFSKLLPRRRLPKALEDSLESENVWENVYEGQAGESTDSSVRYAGYASRVRTILMSAHRYVAYTSDIGESFRPIAHPYLVKGAYGISWAYLIGDVSHEGYKAYLRNQRVLNPEGDQLAGGKDITSDKQHAGTTTTLGAGPTGNSTATINPGRVVPIEDYRAVMAQRAVFQTLASMALPAFTIHSIVRYSGQALKNVKNVRIRTFGPIGLGLAAVPALPFAFDQPVEHAIEYIFHQGFKLVGGPEAVGERPITGRQELRQQETRAGAAKEKEL